MVTKEKKTLTVPLLLASIALPRLLPQAGSMEGKSTTVCVCVCVCVCVRELCANSLLSIEIRLLCFFFLFFCELLIVLSLPFLSFHPSLSPSPSFTLPVTVWRRFFQLVYCAFSPARDVFSSRRHSREKFCFKMEERILPSALVGLFFFLPSLPVVGGVSCVYRCRCCRLSFSSMPSRSTAARRHLSAALK